MNTVSRETLREEAIKTFQRDLKERVSDVLFQVGPNPTLLRRNLEDRFYGYSDIETISVSRVGKHEVSIRVETKVHGTIYFRLLVKGESTL